MRLGVTCCTLFCMYSSMGGPASLTFNLLSTSLSSSQRGDLEGARRLVQELRELDEQMEAFEVLHYGKAPKGVAKT